MNYSHIKDAANLSEFLLEGLSDETLLAIYKEKREFMFLCGVPNGDVSNLLTEYVQNMFYTAALNLIQNQEHLTRVQMGRMIDQAQYRAT